MAGQTIFRGIEQDLSRRGQVIRASPSPLRSKGSILTLNLARFSTDEYGCKPSS